MIKRLWNFLLDTRDRQRINIALSKGGAMMGARNIDLTAPGTWEFSGFSQNGEDGILDVLRKEMLSKNRYSIEIGAADGIENNTSWLIVAEKYNGLLIDGDPRLVERASRTVCRYSIGASARNIFVTKDNVSELESIALYKDPDVLSLDIDGNDYYIAERILSAGFRPKIFVVEYNSVFGPDRSVTIKYQNNFYFKNAHVTHLYYGASVSGWRKLFDAHGYRFVTVDRNGVNAFFVDPSAFDRKFINGIRGLLFAENQYQYSKFGVKYEAQFALIAECEMVDI